MIPVRALFERLGVRADSILHVGAHEAEEYEEYKIFGFRSVTWVEMNARKSAELIGRFRGDESQRVINAAAWDKSGETIRIHNASNVQSSSLLAPHLHLQMHPEVSFDMGEEVVTTRLDEILDTNTSYDFVNMDIQGAELRALAGMGLFLQQASWVYLEVNTEELYRDCALLPDVDKFLNQQGFIRIATKILPQAWGDAIYLNEKNFSPDRVIELRQTGQFI
mgnify:CR=1 FL=1